ARGARRRKPWAKGSPRRRRRRRGDRGFGACELAARVDRQSLGDEVPAQYLRPRSTVKRVARELARSETPRSRSGGPQGSLGCRRRSPRRKGIAHLAPLVLDSAQSAGEHRRPRLSSPETFQGPTRDRRTPGMSALKLIADAFHEGGWPMW